LHRASAADVVNLAARMTQAEDELTLKAAQAEHNRLRDTVEKQGLQLVQKATEAQARDMMARIAVCEEEITTKASSELCQVLRQRVFLAEKALDQKADRKEADRCLQSIAQQAVKVASKASADDLMHMKQDHSSQLQCLRDETATLKSQSEHVAQQCDDLAGRLDRKPEFWHLPVAPNLLRDTKHFAGLCKGQRHLRQRCLAQARDDALGGDWVGGPLDATDGTPYANVAEVAYECYLEVRELSAHPEDQLGRNLGELSKLMNSALASNGRNYRGGDVCAVVVDVNFLKDDGGQCVLSLLSQNKTPLFTTWETGLFSTQVSVFVNVLDAEGEIKYHLLGRMGGSLSGRGAGVTVDSSLKGRGWVHLFSARKGLGGNELSYFEGRGSMRVAIALPYCGMGDHRGTPVWAGYISDYYAQDTRVITSKAVR